MPRFSFVPVTTALASMLVAGPQPALAQGHPVLAPVTLPTPVSFRRAVAAGTRTMTGAPGPRYWQNGSDYDIHVRIVPADSLLQGEETVTYHNRSPDTLTSVAFHLYQNLMNPHAARSADLPFLTAGMVLEHMEVDGRALALPDNQVGHPSIPDSVSILGTIMTVPLRQPLVPGDSVRFHVAWHFTIPPKTAPRMGMQDSTTAQIAQWYPQIAVYDDVRGWDQQQYVGRGEFYLDYGRFTYSVTLPAGYIVGGTGTLTNADQVLSAGVRGRLARASHGEVVHALTAADFGAGGATTGRPGDQLTWRFTADSVRDVAFSFSNHYLWDVTRALVDSAAGRYATVNVLYRPGSALFTRVADMARAALETHSRRMVPYPYAQLTETEGGSGGMEYPMTVFVHAYADVYRMDQVSAHEIGHEWFPMLVGSNETRYGWQDEGLNTFDTFFATDDYLPALKRHGLDIAQTDYLRFVTTADEDLQTMSPSNAFGVVDGGYSVEMYRKPSASLWALRSILGAGRFDRAYRTYIRRWEYKHPTPWDFFHTMSDVAGENLNWFWGPWFFSRGRLDQAVAGVTQRGNAVTVTIANRGELYAPIDLTATLANGTTVSWRERASVWFGGAAQVTSRHQVAGAVRSVEIDAERNFPDVDRTNNTWHHR